MGGNALSVPSIRLQRADYAKVEQTVVELFESHGIKVYCIKQISPKESFGDLDIVVDASTDRTKIGSIIATVSTELVKNSDVWSFGLDGFQVDVVFSTSPAYTATWMAYSDASNIVGRLLHKLGLKYGHMGLYLPVRSSADRVLGNIVLTHNIDIVHYLVGLDPAKWHSGFSSTTEIYEWVATSSFYNPDIFLLDNRNAKARQRDSKRPTYTGLLKWISEQPWGRTYYAFEKDKRTYLPEIFEMFPHAAIEYDRLMSEAAHADRVKAAWQEKLPTEFLMSDTQLSGKELGAFIKYLRSVFDDDMMLSSTTEDIRTMYNIVKERFVK